MEAEHALVLILASAPPLFDPQLACHGDECHVRGHADSTDASLKCCRCVTFTVCAVIQALEDCRAVQTAHHQQAP
eukprot:5623519-Prymnesium_polylepis.3